MIKIQFFIFIILLTSSCSDPIVIAHRGASGYLPEHTLEALSLAHGMNPDFIEPDVVMTKDDELIVLHDIHLDSTTNVKEVFPNRSRKDGLFYAIDFSLEEIKRLKVTERSNNNLAIYPKRFPVNKSLFTIPTLNEWIELLQGLNKSRKKQIGIYVEYKSPLFHKNEGKDIGKKLVETLDQYGYQNNKDLVFIQCFDPNFLANLKTKYRKIQLLADNSWKLNHIDYDRLISKKGLSEISKYAYGVGPHFSQILGKELVDNAHAQDLKVHVYTLRKDSFPKTFKTYEHFKNELLKIGIDGFFTDFPDL